MQKFYYSDKQVGTRYGVHRSTVWRWVRNGDFPPPDSLSKGCSRWPLQVIEDWEKKRSSEGRG